MPPQTPTQPPGQPSDPNQLKPYMPTPGSKFDFILNASQKPKRNLLGAISQVPRAILIPVVIIVLLFGLITVSSILSGRNDSTTKQLVSLAARQQEIVRVSGVAANLLQDNITQNLEATAKISLASDQAQLLSYLKTNHIKADTKSLSVRINKSTDTQLAAARQSNNADEVYTAYLKTQLTDYRNAIQAAFLKAGPKARVILNDSFDSAGVILDQITKK